MAVVGFALEISSLMPLQWKEWYCGGGFEFCIAAIMV